MVQKQDSHYDSFVSYAEELHEKNRKRVKASGILMIVLPVVLGLIRWMTDSDKTVFLIIWVLCMFILSAYLVSIEYMDHVLYKKLSGLTGNDEEYDSLVNGEAFASRSMKKAIRSMEAAEAAADEEAEAADAEEAVDAEEPEDAVEVEEPEEPEAAGTPDAADAESVEEPEAGGSPDAADAESVEESEVAGSPDAADAEEAGEGGDE